MLLLAATTDLFSWGMEIASLDLSDQPFENKVILTNVNNCLKLTVHQSKGWIIKMYEINLTKE